MRPPLKDQLEAEIDRVDRYSKAWLSEGDKVAAWKQRIQKLEKESSTTRGTEFLQVSQMSCPEQWKSMQALFMQFIV